MRVKQSSDDISIVWFKRDLRVTDHLPLLRASQLGRVIPLYIVEPDYWALPDTSGRQWLFIRECLQSLQYDLAELSAPLIVRTGKAEEVLAQLIQETGARQVFSHEETGNLWTFERDKSVSRLLKSIDVTWTEYPQFGITRGKTDRDKWSKAWDHFMSQPQYEPPRELTPLDGLASEPLPSQVELGLSDICPGRQKGGRALGLATLESFLLERGETYQKGMSSPVTATQQCSRLSTFLSTGTLSMRETAQTLWQRQTELKELSERGERLGPWRGSMRSFNGRLHWHCHFMQKLEDEPSQEYKSIHPYYDGVRGDPQIDEAAAARLWAWSEGQTGLPFVDACMRSLNATGWINFRMRAMLMAVASYHLWLDWRQSGLLYAQKFTDYEPGIHWPQVQMQSGTTGINTVRVYNPVKQGYDQDTTGAFTRHWVPELVDVPNKYLQEPWKWPEAPTLIPRGYPERIVDHEQAARDAKAKIYAVRKQEGHFDIARAIADKHGSRKPTDRQKREWARKREAKRKKAESKSKMPENLDLFATG